MSQGQKRNVIFIFMLTYRSLLEGQSHKQSAADHASSSYFVPGFRVDVTHNTEYFLVRLGCKKVQYNYKTQPGEIPGRIYSNWLVPKKTGCYIFVCT